MESRVYFMWKRGGYQFMFVLYRKKNLKEINQNNSGQGRRFLSDFLIFLKFSVIWIYYLLLSKIYY